MNVNIISPRFLTKFSRDYLLRGIFLFFGLFSKIPLEKYDKFIISTSGVGEFILFRNYKKGQTYAYVHTPLRDANKKVIEWNLKNRYRGFFSKLIYLTATKMYIIFENLAWKRMDHIIFNSELSKQRAEEHNLIKNKKISIVFPKINIPKKRRRKKGDYLLYVSRINPPKRQEELIKAFNRILEDYPKLKLILVGTPDNKKYFKKITKNLNNNIKIKSGISEEELENLYCGNFSWV